MALTERLALLVTLDANGAVNGFNKIGSAAEKNLKGAESRIDRVAGRMQKAGVGMLGAATLAGTGLYKAGQAAADLEQAVGGTEAVFGDVSQTIEKFAKDAASDMGLSERAFREATTGIGGQLKGLGFDVDEAAEKSIELTRTAADLAATYGGTTADAVSALGSALRGEADPAERFNLFLNQTRVNAKAVELGLASTTAQVDANAKAQATLALITEQSADAQGQFAREAGTAAGQMQIASAEWENAKASLGESIAPVMADIAGGLSSVASGFSEANEASGGFLGKLAGFATVGLGAAGALSFTVGKLIDMRSNLGRLTGSFRGAEGGLSRFGKTMTGLGIAGTVAGLAALANSMNEVKFSVDDLQAIAGKTGGVERLGEMLVGLSQTIAGDALPGIIRDTADANQLLAEEMIDAAEAAGLDAEKVAELREITEVKRDSDVQGTKDQAAYNAEVQEAAGVAGEAAEGVAGLSAEVQNLSDKLRAQFDPLFGAQDALTDLEDAQTAVTEAVKEYGRNSPEAVEANRKAVEAAMGYESALSDLKTAVDDGSVSIDDAKAALYRWADQGYITKKAADEALWSFFLLKGQADKLDGTNAVVKVSADTGDAFFRLSLLNSLVRGLNGYRVNISSAFSIFGSMDGGQVPQYLASGGRPRGTDTVPAMLTPGEFVMKRSAVDRIGVGMLSALNSGAGLGGAPTSITVPVYIGDRLLETVVVEAAHRYETRNTARWRS